MKQALTWIGFVVGAAALILQLALSLPLRMATGDSLIGALVFYFSFFTILTNLALVLIYASEIWPRLALGWFRAPVTRGMMAGAITLVMIFYHVVLAETWDPQGLGLLADTALHYATPLFYLVWWTGCVRHGRLRWTDVPAMLLPPTIYLIYAMVRGALIEEYPYPILEADRIGYGAVAYNVLVVLLGLTALCLIVVSLDRALGRFTLWS
ncbi:MAG TPA: Pr6Pr family membrane protein [Devosia sp.]|nr:Pr6Pr family membrane protein [Devosia sp.]